MGGYAESALSWNEIMECIKASTKYFSDSDFNYLEELKGLFINKAAKTDFEGLIKKYSQCPKNGIIMDIENDIKAYYKIEINNRFNKTLKNRYSNENKEGIYHLILERINSIKYGEFNFLESIYENKINIINYNGKEIKVKEICRKDWKYILFSDDNGKYYIECSFGTIGRYTEIFEITEEDKKIVEKGTEDEKIKKINGYSYK
jgi:hypothetical protein